MKTQVQHAEYMLPVREKEYREELRWGPCQPCKRDDYKEMELRVAKQMESLNMNEDWTGSNTTMESEEDWMNFDSVAQPAWAACPLEPVNMYSERQCPVLSPLHLLTSVQQKDRQDVLVCVVLAAASSERVAEAAS
jgi:hypothetical protein